MYEFLWCTWKIFRCLLFRSIDNKTIIDFIKGTIFSSTVMFVIQIFILALCLGFTHSFYHFLVDSVVIYFMILQLQQVHGIE